MINPTGKKIEKLLFRMFDDAIQGVDTYNHNGSLWLIFTDEMKWVVEYTQAQTLWYNYYFFKNEMEMISLDCVDNKDLIQKWFESRFLNMGEVKVIGDLIGQDAAQVENTIQNGVKDTNYLNVNTPNRIEDTIQNGVKNTKYCCFIFGKLVEDTIQNGVKETISNVHPYPKEVRDTIQNGVKKIRWNGELGTNLCEDVIKNGVKRTDSLTENNPARIEDTIQNGVKEIIKSDFYRISRIKDVTQNGVKELDTKELSDSQVNRIIKNSIKEK